jgi:hypothetical protein
MIIVFCVGIFCSAGYALNKQGSDDINKQIKVFNISLFANADNRAVNGVAPRREACIKGYEFYYDDLDLVVSFTQNDSVWRITSRNKNTTMFGIAPGDSFSQAKKKIMQSGFAQSYTPYKFVKDWCLFTLLVNEKNKVFGMTVEVLD